ncbi:hypothetical protein GCM10018785_16510 [Streptomyces longispororuber]|uniref:DUF2795 domain-containing protein n=2 Tax=Streptomyces longispororuber TaxID=68230 RepID=A0A918ZDF5_9ACTN|nr:hypothetical protein GCM10018785_16510 [Streptomyces longispororuber]
MWGTGDPVPRHAAPNGWVGAARPRAPLAPREHPGLRPAVRACGRRAHRFRRARRHRLWTRRTAFDVRGVTGCGHDGAAGETGVQRCTGGPVPRSALPFGIPVRLSRPAFPFSKETVMASISPIDLQKALKGATYPSSRDDLVSLARDNGADDGLVEKLSNASTDSFDGPDEVQKAVFDNE